MIWASCTWLTNIGILISTMVVTSINLRSLLPFPIFVFQPNSVTKPISSLVSPGYLYYNLFIVFSVSGTWIIIHMAVVLLL